MSAPPVVVFDYMTFLQATTSVTGPSAACLMLVEAGQLRLALSPAIMAEVRDALSRPQIRRRNPDLDDAAVEAYLARLAELSPPVADVPRVITYPRDPKDEPYLDLAAHAKAAFLVSFDNDLIDLMAEGNADGVRIRALVPGLEVVTPPELLRRWRERQTQSPEGPA